MSETSTQNKTFYTVLLTSFMLVALAMGVYLLSNLDTDSILSMPYPMMFVLATLAYFSSSLIYIKSWQLNLRLCGVEGVSFYEATLNSGIAFLGKYIPGKIGGIIVRGWSLNKARPESTDAIIKATLVEQGALIHAGLIICLSLFALEGSNLSKLVCLLLVILSFIGVLLLPRFLALAERWLLRFPKVETMLNMLRTGFLRPYFTTLAFMLVVWLVVALGLYFCALSFDVEISGVRVVYITTLSFLVGFAALILPAGIGAREAVLVVLLVPHSSALLAATIAGMFRAVTLTVDLLIGAYAMRNLAATAYEEVLP